MSQAEEMYSKSDQLNAQAATLNPLGVRVSGLIGEPASLSAQLRSRLSESAVKPLASRRTPAYYVQRPRSITLNIIRDISTLGSLHRRKVHVDSESIVNSLDIKGTLVYRYSLYKNTTTSDFIVLFRHCVAL